MPNEISEMAADPGNERVEEISNSETLSRGNQDPT